MAYFTLCQRDGGQWAPQFGDHDRETVAMERDDYRQHGVKASDLQIVRTASARKALVDARVAELNR
jgi:hypothetical protein